MFGHLLEDLVVFWVVVDPIGSVPVFLAVTPGVGPDQRRAIARRAVRVAAGILLGFLVLGQVLLELMHIPLTAFQIGGGVVLFLFALTMIFGEAKPEQEKALRPGDAGDAAIFPIAVPSIASPGAMLAAIVLTDNHRFSVGHQAVSALALLLVLAATWLFLRLAEPIHRRIGDGGASIVSRVMGLVLAAAAADYVLEGFKLYFGIG